MKHTHDRRLYFSALLLLFCLITGPGLLIWAGAAEESSGPAVAEAADAPCVGEIGCLFLDDATVEFTYTWTWRERPRRMGKDGAAVSYRAYNTDGEEIGVLLRSTKAEITYWDEDGPVHVEELGREEPLIAPLQFSIPLSGKGTEGGGWAKTGTITTRVSLSTGSTAELGHLQVSGLYGHTLLGFSAPEITAFSLSGGSQYGREVWVDALAPAAARLSQAGGVERYEDPTNGGRTMSDADRLLVWAVCLLGVVTLPLFILVTRRGIELLLQGRPYLREKLLSRLTFAFPCWVAAYHYLVRGNSQMSGLGLCPLLLCWGLSMPCVDLFYGCNEAEREGGAEGEGKKRRYRALLLCLLAAVTMATALLVLR